MNGERSKASPEQGNKIATYGQRPYTPRILHFLETGLDVFIENPL
jgi:hypothetical protein